MWMDKVKLEAVRKRRPVYMKLPGPRYPRTGICGARPATEAASILLARWPLA